MVIPQTSSLGFAQRGDSMRHHKRMTLDSIDELQRKLAVTEEALRLSEERAAAGQLALELMHEVKNPLETLGHLTYLALAESDQNAVKAYLRQADEQVRTLGQIATQTLNFARESSAPQILRATILLEAAIRIHQRRIDRKKIHLVTDPTTEHQIKVYPGQILQVLSNLIANSIDALPDEGYLHLVVRKRRDRMEIMIADNGAGINKAHRERIFDPFFSTKGASGNGLGLSLSKKIIDRHQGSIRMHSSSGLHRTGTVFRISFPA
jgi:signal transduction histidine kinase